MHTTKRRYVIVWGNTGIETSLYAYSVEHAIEEFMKSMKPGVDRSIIINCYPV